MNKSRIEINLSENKRIIEMGLAKVNDGVNKKIRVISLKKTCPATPSQWSGITDDNRKIYYRYRWGYLTISVSAPNDTNNFNVIADEIAGLQLNEDGWAGLLLTKDMIDATESLIEHRLSHQDIEDMIKYEPEDEVRERNFWAFTMNETTHHSGEEIMIEAEKLAERMKAFDLAITKKENNHDLRLRKNERDRSDDGRRCCLGGATVSPEKAFATRVGHTAN